MCVCICSRVCVCVSRRRLWRLLCTWHDNMATDGHERSGFVFPEDCIIACHSLHGLPTYAIWQICDMLCAVTERPRNCSQVDTDNQESLFTIVDDKVVLLYTKCCCPVSSCELFRHPVLSKLKIQWIKSKSKIWHKLSLV